MPRLRGRTLFQGTLETAALGDVETGGWCDSAGEILTGAAILVVLLGKVSVVGAMKACACGKRS